MILSLCAPMSAEMNHGLPQVVIRPLSGDFHPQKQLFGQGKLSFRQSQYDLGSQYDVAVPADRKRTVVSRVDCNASTSKKLLLS